MAELEELTHKIHILIEQLEQVHDENKKLKHENKELVCKLDRFHYENVMLKRELEAMCENLKMKETQSAAVSISEPLRDYTIKCGRIRPFDSEEDSNEDRERKKGGKKTSL